MDGIEPADLDCLTGEWVFLRRSPLPDGVDEDTAALLTKARECKQFPLLRDLLSPREASLLRTFTKRMSVLAVRRRDPSLCRLAILAVGLASLVTDDWRDECTVVSLCWRSAHLLGLDAEREFRDAAALLPGEEPEGYDPGRGRHFLLSWLERKPEDQTIGCMGFAETTSPDGFSYQPI